MEVMPSGIGKWHFPDAGYDRYWISDGSLVMGQKGNIPDIHPAYCGLRGLTLSSHRQHHAWDILVAAGLKQVMIKRHAN